jgi:hypothetical protein
VGGFDQAKVEYKIGNKTYYSSPSDSFDYKFGLIDKTGNILSSDLYLCWRFLRRLSCCQDKRRQVWIYDKTGKVIIETKFNWAGSFSEGLACVYVNGKYGFINKNGEIIIKPTFTDAGNFSEGLAYVKLGGRVREHSLEASITTLEEIETLRILINWTNTFQDKS